MLQRLYSNRQAFTLVELIMVIGILGALALMSIPAFTQYWNKTKSGVAAADIRTHEKAIVAYALDKQYLPATLADAGITQLDPWQRPYEYNTTPTLEYSLPILLNTDFDLYSKGVDGLSDPSGANPASKDDIVRTNNGGFAGLRDGL